MTLSINQPLFGAPGEDLTGPESRSLRAALNLERRHVVALANALRIGDRIVTTELLTNWERSKARGYPLELVDALNDIERALCAWADALPAAARTTERLANDGVGTLRRPLGAGYVIHQLMAHNLDPLLFRADVLKDLEQGGGDFWQALADAAIVRAAQSLRASGMRARVVMDREPDGAMSPSAQ